MSIGTVSNKISDFCCWIIHPFASYLILTFFFLASVPLALSRQQALCPVNITVTKTIDLNGNGIKDENDTLPLPAGVITEIILSKNGIPVETAIMGNDSVAQYTFCISSPGIYTVEEIGVLKGWMQTAGGIHTMLVGDVPISDSIAFLSFQFGTVRGTKYYDANRNAVRDAGEPGLKNWIIQASGAGGSVASTDADGQYVITGLGPGPHAISEVQVPPWAQTAPLSGAYRFDGVSGLDLAGLDFGNYKPVHGDSSISGRKFYDVNDNEIEDAADSGLANWNIVLRRVGTPTPIDTAVTASDGSYSFRSLQPGAYTVEELLLPRWEQTYPPSGMYSVIIDSLGTSASGIDFGNYLPAYGDSTISGVVDADINNNGSVDEPDFGLPNQTVVLFKAGFAQPLDTAITGPTGQYAFRHIPPGQYIVEHLLAPPWTQTYPPAGFQIVTVDSLGNGGSWKDFGCYRLVTADTARTVVTEEIIGSRPDNNVLKAFEFHIPGSSNAPAAAQVTATGGSLPAGTLVYSFDSSVVYQVTRPKFFYWFDLEGDLKFGHRCLYVFVDQAAQAETVAAQWWPIVKLPGGSPIEVWNSWDNRVTSADIIHGGYGPGNQPLARGNFPSFAKRGKASTFSVASFTGKAALLLGGKAESPTELETWQHDLDSVRATLIYGSAGNPPAVDSTKVIVENDVTYATFYSRLGELANCDTLYLFFTGHGDASAGGGIVLNDIGGRTVLSYALLSELLYDSLHMKRLYMLIDASNSGKAIDDFMRTTAPVVNLVTSTDAFSPAGSGLPADTQSTYTKAWRHTSLLAPLPPGVNLNWRRLNSTLRADNVSLASSQNPPDTTNAPLFVTAVTGLSFPNVGIGDSSTIDVTVSNFGFIPLDVDSIQISGPDFYAPAGGAGSIARNAMHTFPIVFKPSASGNRSATVTFYHNGEYSQQSMPAAGFGIYAFDTLKYRTFTQDSLCVKPVKKKPASVQFCATFPNTADWTRQGILVKFSFPVKITYTDRFTDPPQSGDGGIGKIWLFTGTTVPVRTPVTICGVGSKGKLVQVSSYTWISGNPVDIGRKLSLFPSTPAGQQLLLPMPNGGNMRDVLFKVSDYLTNGMVLGTPLPPPENEQYGWIRIQKSANLVKFFYDRGSIQSGDPRPFNILGIRPFTGERKNLTAIKYSNHLAGELAALHFGITASTLAITPPGLGELIYDDSTGAALNGLLLRTIADSADRILTFRWGPFALYHRFDEVITNINSAFSGPMDTISFGAQLRAKGVRSPEAIRYIRPSGIQPVQIKPLAEERDEPEHFTLFQNYPNPFNPTTTIEFNLTAPSRVTLKVYNVLGQEVATLLDRQQMDDGLQDVDFSANALSSGVYFYRLEVVTAADEENDVFAQTRVEIKKMLLLK